MFSGCRETADRVTIVQLTIYQRIDNHESSILSEILVDSPEVIDLDKALFGDAPNMFGTRDQSEAIQPGRPCLGG